MRAYLYNLATDKSSGFIPAIIKFFLLPLSFLYGLAVKFLAFFYRLRPFRLACKVISVGNITLGGTGKTPLVEYIVRYLSERGHRVAVVSRGYRRKIKNPNGSTPLTISTERSRSANFLFIFTFHRPTLKPSLVIDIFFSD